MAEVRQIPSAVGAFEAQVFDLSKTYRAIMSQASAQIKAQQDAKREMDKMMANTYAAKGKGRLQDMPELENQYNELQNYYINNNAAIIRGGNEALEFQKKRSEFIFEAEQANLRKERDKQLSPFFKMNLEKEGMSDKSTELMTIFNLPYTDPRRREYRYEGADGEMHGIDELNVADIEKYRKFNESELMSTIVKTAPAVKVKDLTIEPGSDYGLPGGYKIAVTGEFSIRDPLKIAQAVTGELAGKPDARKTYGAMFQNETEESLQKASQEFRLFNQIYKQAGYTQFVNTETDNQPGITNETEYALYRNLKANLPQDLGERISASLVSAKLGIERMNLQNRKWSNFLSVQQQNTPIDQAANLFFDTNPSVQQLKDFANSESKLLGVTYAGGGGTLPSKVNYIEPGKFDPKRDAPGLTNIGMPSTFGNRGVMVYTSQNMARDNDGNPIKDEAKARERYGMSYNYKVDKKTNNVYVVESFVVPVSGISAAERGRLLKDAYLRASEAQKGQEAYDMMYKGLFRSGQGAIPEPQTNIQVGGRGKGSSFKTGTSFSESGMQKK